MLSQFLDCPIKSGNDRHGVGRADSYSERRAMTGGVRVRLADCQIKLGNRFGQHTQWCNGTIIKKGVTPRGHHPA